VADQGHHRYEFNADELSLDGFIAGPITDKLGIRIAGYHDTMKGWLKNANPNDPRHRLPLQEDDGGRFYLKYTTRTRFQGEAENLRLNVDANWWRPTALRTGCALGNTPARAEYRPFDNCVLDDVNAAASSVRPILPATTVSAVLSLPRARRP